MSPEYSYVRSHGAQAISPYVLSGLTYLTGRQLNFEMDENFQETILMEVNNDIETQQVRIVVLVYKKPKDDNSLVHFELQNKTYESNEYIWKCDFRSIAKHGKLKKFDPLASLSSTSFNFEAVESPDLRCYIAFISVPCMSNGKIIVAEMPLYSGTTAITTDRLPNQRLKIN